MVLTVVVVLLNDQLGGVDVVDPCGRLFIIFALARDGVDKHRTVVVRAAEKTDSLFLLGADPVGRAFLVDLKDRLFEHIGRIGKAQMAIEISREMLGGRVLHAVFKAHDVDILRHHVDDEIGGKAFGAVVEPLDDVTVAKRRDAHGATVIVDLRVVRADLELRDHVGKFTEFAVAELLCAVLVKHGNAVVGDFVDLLGEAAIFDGQQRLIVLRAQHHPRCQRADERRDDEQCRNEERHGALLFDESEVALRARALKA